MLSLTVAARSKLIRAATPNCLEELFEMSNRMCDLCNYPIQDLIVAALDHSTPVIHFARDLSLPIEEAVRQANDLKNLRPAHKHCNHVKHEMTREEWFAKGVDKKVGKPKMFTDAELLELQFRFAAGSRASGRMNAEKKIGVCGRSPEKMSEGGRKASREDKACAGRIGGAKSGPVNGPASQEKGIGIFAPGMKRIAGLISTHNHWHIKRGLVSSTCSLCQQQKVAA